MPMSPVSLHMSSTPFLTSSPRIWSLVSVSHFYLEPDERNFMYCMLLVTFKNKDNLGLSRKINFDKKLLLSSDIHTRACAHAHTQHTHIPQTPSSWYMWPKILFKAKPVHVSCLNTFLSSIAERIHIQLSVLCTFGKGKLKEVGNMCDKFVNRL